MCQSTMYWTKTSSFCDNWVHACTCPIFNMERGGWKINDPHCDITINVEFHVWKSSALPRPCVGGEHLHPWRDSSHSLRSFRASGHWIWCIYPWITVLCMCVNGTWGLSMFITSHHKSHHPSVSTHTFLSTSHVFFLRISRQKINPQIPRSTVVISHHKNPKKMVALSSLKK